ncbi:hypothetical protein [Solimonas terrae]|uniref:Uncharacterized protein n=1 Tax=Solimonas terrae TaxID=1396819 RepID=A0A6M2BRP4_9GAMM|nr:hypothetical protein [Solimonas terrae]NGY04699.1 hypothetical protein [Solimonas terrae]
MQDRRERNPEACSRTPAACLLPIMAAACALSACSSSPSRPAADTETASAAPRPLHLRLTSHLSSLSSSMLADRDAAKARAPVAASGHEPPVTRTAAATDAATPADHPATPAPEAAHVPTPPTASDTDATPPQVFETDVRGETVPGEAVVIGTKSADDEPLDPVHLCTQLAPGDEQTIAQTKRRVEEMVCTASMWFDGLFGDRYYISESRKVNGTVELSDNYSQFYGNTIRLRFDAQVPLPNLNRHLSAFIGRDNEEDFVHDRFDNSTLRNNFPKVDDHEKLFAGLGYELPGSDRFSTSFRAGVRGLARPEAFVQSRLRYNAYADDNDLVNLRATPFYTTADRLGVTLGADYSHVLDQTMLIRFGNVGTWSQSTQGLDWRSTLTVYQALLSIRCGLAYELFVRGETGDDVPLHEYGLQTTFRHPIFGGKLYGEWVLGYSFPREDLDQQRSGSYLAGVSLQMPFGKQP